MLRLSRLHSLSSHPSLGPRLLRLADGGLSRPQVTAASFRQLKSGGLRSIPPPLPSQTRLNFASTPSPPRAPKPSKGSKGPRRDSRSSKPAGSAGNGPRSLDIRSRLLAARLWFSSTSSATLYSSQFLPLLLLLLRCLHSSHGLDTPLSLSLFGQAQWEFSDSPT